MGVWGGKLAKIGETGGFFVRLRTKWGGKPVTN